MYRNLIVLPDGTEIFSGLGAANAIQSCTITSAANSGTELTPGSVCCDMLETKFFAPKGNLNILVGSEMTLYKVDESGNRIPGGLFTMESPERPSRNTYRITAYDRVSWLERDLTPWLESLDGWPYDLLTFARMVCDECLLTLANDTIPNAGFPVNRFPAAKMTGRALMGYIGQIAGRFCRATVDGQIEFAWYTDSGITLQPTGERFYSSLKASDYQVERIEAVQVQLAEAEYGMLFPETEVGYNSYIISGNPLITFVNEDLLPYLDVLLQEIRNAVYTPCKVTLPASLDIRPGHILRIIDQDEKIIDTYVMTKTQKGSVDTIESTGSARRDTPAAVNEKTPEDYVTAAMKRQTQLELFNKLTNYGAVQGLFLAKDGQIFINAAYMSTGILQSKNGTTFYLDLDEGILKMNATELEISGQSLGSAALKDMSQEELVAVLTKEGFAKGIYLHDGQLYINAEYINTGTLNASLMKAGVLQSNDDGETFKLDLDAGTFSMSGTGKFMSPDGKSYITVDGGSFVLYAQDAYGSFVDIARIGFSEDSEGVDYPYMLLGNPQDTEEGKLSLVKAFANGIYIGNAVPKLSTGNFIGLPGAVGFFVDMVNQKTYNVVGDELYDAFTAVFG